MLSLWCLSPSLVSGPGKDRGSFTAVLGWPSPKIPGPASANQVRPMGASCLNELWYRDLWGLSLKWSPILHSWTEECCHPEPGQHMKGSIDVGRGSRRGEALCVRGKGRDTQTVMSQPAQCLPFCSTENYNSWLHISWWKPLVHLTRNNLPLRCNV